MTHTKTWGTGIVVVTVAGYVAVDHDWIHAGPATAAGGLFAAAATAWAAFSAARAAEGSQAAARAANEAASAENSATPRAHIDNMSNPNYLVVFLDKPAPRLEWVLRRQGHVLDRRHPQDADPGIDSEFRWPLPTVTEEGQEQLVMTYQDARRIGTWRMTFEWESRRAGGGMIRDLTGVKVRTD